jgi:hypothetical protein
VTADVPRKPVGERESRDIAWAFLVKSFGDQMPNGGWELTEQQEHHAAWSLAHEWRPWKSTTPPKGVPARTTVVVSKWGGDPWLAWFGRRVAEQIAQGGPTLG